MQCSGAAAVQSIAVGETYHMELETPLRYVNWTHDSRIDAQVK